MKFWKNEFGVAIAMDESKIKPGVYQAFGGGFLIEAAQAQGFTEPSVTVNEKGVMLRMNKPFRKKTEGDKE